MSEYLFKIADFGIGIIIKSILLINFINIKNKKANRLRKVELKEAL